MFDKKIERTSFLSLLADVKLRIQTAQTRAMLAVNSELVRLYWDIGRMIDVRQKLEGWGTGVIPRLSAELKNELLEVKGFSKRNINYMIRFAREYGASLILQQPAAKLAEESLKNSQHIDTESNIILPQVAAKLPGLFVLLFQNFLFFQKDFPEHGYANFWFRNHCALQIHCKIFASKLIRQSNNL